MVGRITPIYVPKPVGMLGWDGTDFWAVKVDTSGRVQVRGSDQLFSFHDRLHIAISATVSGANGYISSGAVPAGVVWVITQAGARDNTTATTSHYYCVYDGATLAYVYELKGTIVQWQMSSLHSQIYLKEGDSLRVYFQGSTSTDNAWLGINGYIMTKES